MKRYRFWSAEQFIVEKYWKCWCSPGNKRSATSQHEMPQALHNDQSHIDHWPSPTTISARDRTRLKLYTNKIYPILTLAHKPFNIAKCFEFKYSPAIAATPHISNFNVQDLVNNSIQVPKIKPTSLFTHRDINPAVWSTAAVTIRPLSIFCPPSFQLVFVWHR
jgi:hypothetical protein